MAESLTSTRSAATRSRLLAFMLTAILALTGAFALAAPRTAHAAQGGSFAFAVINNSGSAYVVEPTLVSYQEGQTLKEAIESHPELEVSFNNGFISDIKGNGSSLVSWYTGGWNTDLQYDVPASSVDALLCSYYYKDGAFIELTENHATLLAAMGSYLGRTDGVRNYADAQTAYSAARNALRTGDADATASAAASLQDAIAAYDALMSGAKYPIKLDIRYNGSASGISVTIKDSYNNETVAGGSSSVQLIPGTYRYWANSANGRFGVYGEFQVTAQSATKTISATLPTANWVSSIDLYDLDAPGYTNVANPSAGLIPSTGSFEGDNLVYYVPDYARETNSIRVTPRATSAGKTAASSGGSVVLVSSYANVSTGGTYTTGDTESPTYDQTSFRLPYLVKPGAEGTTATFEMTRTVKSPTGNNTVLKEIERSHATIVRTPSLAGLSVADNGTETLSGFASAQTLYTVDAVSDSVSITPTMSVGSYTASVDGTWVASGEPVDVALDGDSTDVPILVDNGEGSTTQYLVTVKKRAGVDVTLTHEQGVEVSVLNGIGSAVHPTSATAESATYKLIPDTSYTYVGTLNTYYHTTSTFKATAGTSIAVPTPNTQDLLTKVDVRASGTATNSEFDEVAGSTLHDSTWTVWDTQTTLFVFAKRLSATSSATKKMSAPANAVQATNWKLRYTSQATGAAAVHTSFNNSGFQKTDPMTMHGGSINGLHAFGAIGQTAVLEVDDALNSTDDVAFYQDYYITINSYPTAGSLDVLSGKQKLIMTRCDANLSETSATGFVNSTPQYSIEIPDSVSSLTLQGSFAPGTNAGYIGGYDAVIGGSNIPQTRHAMSAGTAFSRTVPLDGTDGQLITVRVTSPDDPTSRPLTYIIKVKRLPTTHVSFETTPADATVNLVDDLTGQRILPDEDGEYHLTQTYSYTWSVGAVGYKSQGETITATEDKTYSIALTRAPVNPAINTSITGDWPAFRIGDDNLSTTDALTPTTEEDAVLYWAAQLGAGYSSGAAGCPILVDGYLYSYGTVAGRAMIFKVDTVTGETVAQATMAGSSSFGINPATYAEGMIFIGESGGRVEAFNADTLESLWIYKDPLGGQPNCAITYKDGCIYTGFWNAYTGQYANFVCLTIDDEDPTKPGHYDTYDNKGNPTTTLGDTKRALWTHVTEGGYYWAGACARDEGYVLMGADDGLDEEGARVLGTGHVYSFNSKTGELIDDLTEFDGDVRTQITYDKDTGYYYFMTKSGFFCRVKCNSDGTFDRDTFGILNLGETGTAGVAQCTSTPAFDSGRAYVGVRGTSSFGVNSGHHVAVIDLDSFTVAYRVTTLGYVQATPVVVTGHQSADGYTYVYFIENLTPGKMRVIRDKPGQYEADDWSVIDESYSSGGQEYVERVARVIFTPKGSQAQFAICSPIVDEYGTIYFKNDSAFMMALGSTIEKIEVTTQPARTEYVVGESFDPSGMVVTATYANGKTRDISKYVTCDTSEFDSLGEKQVRISFLHTMYQTFTGTAEAVPYRCPDTFVTVTVGESAPPVVLPTEMTQARATDTYLLTPYPYEYEFKAAASPAVTSWELSGMLPSGLSFNTATGVLSGTPGVNTGGVYPISVTATNALGTSVAQEFALEVVEEPYPSLKASERNVTLPVGTVFSHTYQVSVGYPAPRWDLSIGELPEGLELSSDGTLSGRLTKAGVYKYQLRATNGVGTPQLAREVTFTVTSPAVITTNALASAEVGKAYEVQLEAEGMPAPTWSWVASEGSSLPVGLKLDAATGVISGTPTQGGTYTFTVSAVNDQGDPDTHEFTLVVGEAPAITTESLEPMTAGEAYSATLAATGNPARFIWSVVEGTLPRGVALASDGTLSGTPAAGTGGTYNVTVSVANGVGEPATKAYELVVNEAPAITTAELPAGLAGEAYSAAIEATGAPAPTFALTGGTLPAGFAIDEATGVLSGTAEVGGSYEAVVKATNSAGSAEKTYAVVINAPAAITTAELAAGTVGSGYATTLAASGYPTDMTWSVSAGALPAGLTLNATTGTISGTPTAGGSYAFTVSATNGVGDASTQALSITVAEASAIQTATLPNASVDSAYTATLAATGYPTEFTWSITAGTLPAGLELDATAGTISGTPSATGSFAITVSASNGIGEPATREFTFDVVGGVAILTTTLDAGVVDTAYAAQLTYAGNPAPTWRVTAGALPAGLELDATTGAISGTPTEFGDFAFTVEAGNGVGEPATQELSLTVGRPAAISTTSVDPAVAGAAYAVALEAAGHPAAFTWQLVGGSLPAGLTLGADGVVSGTPHAGGSFAFTAQVTNGVGEPVAREFTIEVSEAPAITTAVLPTASAGTAYAAVIAATGVPAPTFAIADGALPEGLELDATTGAISGTPTAGGACTFTVSAANGVGEDASRTYTLVVQQAPAIATSQLEAAVLGSTYEAHIDASGYPAPTVALIAGSVMPAGLALASDGTVAGTPAEAGDFIITVEAESSVGVVERDIAITVAQAPTITTLALPAALAGSSYSQQLEATSWPGVAWTVEGELPEGLAFSADGRITGTPAANAGGTYPLTFTADNGVTDPVTTELVLTVNQRPQVTTTLLEAAKGEPFSAQLEASGFPAPTFSIAKGSSAPEGLALSEEGVLSGTPTTSGLQSFQVTVSNAGGTMTQIVQIDVAEPASITTASLPDATVGSRYNQALAATGQPAVFTWSIVSGSLPEGLALDADSGIISGTPAAGAGGTATFTVQAANGVGDPATRELSLNVRFAPNITTTSLPSATQRASYSAKLEANGYPTPTWSLASGSSLPAGLTLNSNGTISGSPSKGGTYTFTVVASNGVGDTARRQLTITVESTQATIMRICGENYANETAAAIAVQAFPEGSDWVVIARDDDFADALGAVGLAGALDAPILLTNRFELSAAAATEIQRLGAKHAYIIGGTGAIKIDVDAGLRAIGVSVEPRIWGDNSYDTSLACAREIEAVTGEHADVAIIAMSTNFQDALSMSPYAYKYHVPVVLQTWGAYASDRGFTDEAKAWLAGRSVLVAGGAGAISDASVAPYKLVDRLWGETGYDTSNNIAKWMVERGYLEPGAIVVACGAQAPKGVDALAGAALAGRLSAPMLLATTNTNMESANTTTVDGFLATNAGKVTETYVLGGAYVMPAALYSRIQTMTDAEDITK